ARSVAIFDVLGEPNLVVFGQEGILTDVREIEPDQIFFIPLHSLLGHRSNPSSRRCDPVQNADVKAAAPASQGFTDPRMYDTDLVKPPFSGHPDCVERTRAHNPEATLCFARRPCRCQTTLSSRCSQHSSTRVPAARRASPRSWPGTA